VLLLVALAVMFGGCGKKKKDEWENADHHFSNEALNHFLDGRTLNENLRATDSIEHFQKAFGKRSDFAMAHLYFAQSASTTRSFSTTLSRLLRFPIRYPRANGSTYWAWKRLLNEIPSNNGNSINTGCALSH